MEVLKGTRNCIGVISEGFDNGRGDVSGGSKR